MTHGSHNVRAPGSIGASAWPARVMKGIRGPGQMGNKRITQRGLTVVRVDADRNLLLARAPSRARRTVLWRSAPMPKAPILGGKGSADLDDAVFAQPFHPSLVHETVRARRLRVVRARMRAATAR